MRVVISEFMDEAAVGRLARSFDVRYDPGLVDRREALLDVLPGAAALIVRNRTRVDPPLLERDGVAFVGVTNSHHFGAAGEDTGGVHGANRLGGNGVANSTVYGGIAGESVAAWLAAPRAVAAPDRGAVARARARSLRPFDAPPGDLAAIREALHGLMWHDVGILRDGAGLRRAAGALDELHERLHRTGLADRGRAFNLTWHDWLNLDSLIAVSRAIARAALAREDSRGAHWREDFPHGGALESSAYTRVRQDGRDLALEFAPVEFTRVRPGQSLLAA